jgi:late competence protein required for DNA uptake (superfamily II DNA/RNA helicase)
MIITREISIKINETNYSYYEELGYNVTIGEKLLIPIELLSTGSHQKITCQCDGCGNTKDVIFKNYVKYGNKWGEYYCRKCSESKRKRSLNINHGVDYPIQNKEIKKRIQRTMIEKWGVDNPSKSQELISKKYKN